MDILKDIIPYALPIITAFVGWFGGSRKKKNDFLCEMQKSIDLLSGENTKLVEKVVQLNKEVVELRKENAELLSGQERLRKENAGMKAEIEELNNRLANVKTITKTKKE